MKNIWLVIFIAAIATAALIYFTRVPKMEPSLEEARKNGTLIARYWLDQAIKDNVEAMKQASLGSAVSQAETILEHIHKSEESRKVEFSEYTLFSMGGGGALKAVLSGEGPVILMQMTMIIKERDGKWHVSAISLD